MKPEIPSAVASDASAALERVPAQGSYADLVARGIIDPTKVVRVVLENAVSVASVLLLTEATFGDLPEPRQDGHSPHVED